MNNNIKYLGFIFINKILNKIYCSSMNPKKFQLCILGSASYD